MRPIPRRTFLKTMAAAGTLPLLGCGGGGGGAGGQSVTCSVTGVPSATPPDLPVSARKLPALVAATLPRLRGAHLSEYADWQDPSYTGWVQLPEFPAWGGNVIRLFLCPFDQQGNAYAAGRPLSERLLASLASRQPVIDWCLAHDVHVILCFSTFLLWPVVKNWPEEDGRYLWTDAAAQQEVADAWAALARKFKGQAGILFELMNEPQSHTPSSPKVDEPLPNGALNSLHAASVAAIRAVDSERWIAIAPEWHDAGNLGALTPIADPRLLVAIHFYGPQEFTHQGVFDKASAGTVPYPSASPRGTKDFLQSQLQSARDYQLAHGQRIIVTEFGASRSAPAAGRANWTRDVYSLIEAWGWDSVIFRYEAGMWPECFRESWALEHSEIEQTCRDLFAQNLV